MKMVLFPAIDDDRLEKVREAAGSMRVVNAQSPAEAERGNRGCRGVFWEAHAGTPRLRREIGMGSIADGEPGTLPVSGIDRPSLPAQQYAGVVFGCDRRSCDGLCALLCPESASLSSKAAGALLGTLRRGIGPIDVCFRTRARHTHRPGASAFERSDDGRCRRGAHRPGNLPAGGRFRDDVGGR